MKRLVQGVLAAMAALLAAPMPANAALSLCNRTSYVLYAATAAIKTPRAQTQGWSRIMPGNCQVVRKEALKAETYLIHARSSLAHSGPSRAWGGDFPMCVKDGNFTMTQSVAMAVCGADGTFALPFAALDTGGKANWTMTLDEKPALTSLAAAQLAGVKRLLRDNGYQTGPLDGGPDKPTGAALSAFRKRVRFAAGAGNAQLFDALEAQAMKSNAPAGATVCNDGDGVLEAALGQVNKTGAVSRGWWTVPKGACARAITAPLAAATVYLFARRKTGAVVAGGADKFCIAPAVFEIRGRSDCATRGFAEAGFLAIPTGGRPGYIAHVGNSGLMRPLGAKAKPAVQASMSK